MGITMRQQLGSIADAYEQKELRIVDLQNALLGMVVDEMCIRRCEALKSHPAPWHSDRCDCAIRARKICMEERDARLAKEKQDKP